MSNLMLKLFERSKNSEQIRMHNLKHQQLKMILVQAKCYLVSNH